MYIDKPLILESIIQAYDIFASLDFEKDVVIQDFDLNTAQSTDYTVKALQLNKDTVTVNGNYQFLTEAHPSVYIRNENLPDDPSDSTQKISPDHSQRMYKLEDIDRVYSVDSINKIFNFVIIRLKP